MSKPTKRASMIDAVKSEEAAQREWACGVGYALAEVQRLHDQPTVVLDVARAAGLSYEDLKAAGLDPFDLKPLRRILKPAPKKRVAAKKPESCEAKTQICSGQLVRRYGVNGSEKAPGKERRTFLICGACKAYLGRTGARFREVTS